VVDEKTTQRERQNLLECGAFDIGEPDCNDHKHEFNSDHSKAKETRCFQIAAELRLVGSGNVLATGATIGQHISEGSD
jgi:hypothetical protein